MAELVYAFDLKSNGETRAGSIPAPSTKTTNLTPYQVYFNAYHTERHFLVSDTLSHIQTNQLVKILNSH